MSQSGGTKLSIVIAATLGLGFGASAFLNYQQYQRAQQDKKLLQGQITDLTYQVAQDHSETPPPAPSATPSPSDTPTPSPAPSASPAVAGAAITPAPAATATAKSFVHVRASPSTSAGTAIVTSLNAGDTVTLGSFRSATWQEVTANGHHGYVSRSYLKY